MRSCRRVGGVGTSSITEHAVALVGSVDAVNLTDNPTATPHMSPARRRWRRSPRRGIEPTIQLTVRDRNRLALTGDLLGAWALGARNLFCLSGDPIHVGDHRRREGRRATSTSPKSIAPGASDARRGHDARGRRSSPTRRDS